MNITLSRRFALVVVRLSFPAALLACVSTAWTQDTTYNLVGLVANDQLELRGIGVSGTITTDGSMGNYTTLQDIVSALATVTFYGPQQSYLPSPFELGLMDSGSSSLFYATPDELLMPSGDSFVFQGGYRDQGGLGTATLTYGPATGGVASILGENTMLYPILPIVDFEAHYSQPMISSPIGDAYVIATAQPVPEPASITLLCSALLGFVAVYLRRHVDAVERAACDR